MIEVISDLKVKVKTTQPENPYLDEVIRDYAICFLSRQVSLHVRKDVLNGRGKFGVSGDGKEVPQVAMARAFRKGDFYSGYYRDQTLLFALDVITVRAFFAQLYADIENDKHSGGRNMVNHFGSELIDQSGNWTKHTERYNCIAGHASTAGQMPRALGLAFASNKYASNEHISNSPLSNQGQEVTFSTIGDGSTSEGVFWETMNAAGVLQTPLAVSVWDDGYAISVPVELQTTKGSISAAMAGLASEDGIPGVKIHTAKGWDYPSLCEMYERGIKECREKSEPVLFHVRELTQPQGHSTSGSHERYKSKERLEWEKNHDCLDRMRSWIIDNKLAKEKDLQSMESEVKTFVAEEKKKAWKAFLKQGESRRQELLQIYQEMAQENDIEEFIESAIQQLNGMQRPEINEIIAHARNTNLTCRNNKLKAWYTTEITGLEYQYEKDLYSSSVRSAINIPAIAPIYQEDGQVLNGYEILQQNFDKIFETYPNVYLFGEDVGKIGDVNQGAAGLQEKYGKDRIFDTGIREWTIMGQAQGMAIRGLRPIAEVQYLDYMVYGLATLTDDISTLRFRSNNRQQCPAIIRTRGHRLEGIWHSGSQMGMLIHSLRGMHICVPRNMVQAAGFYNTLLKSDDPAMVIESLNGYRLKERLPENIGEFTIPLGVPETLVEGDDLTVVTYGSCVRIAEAAAERLAELDVHIEVIDIQTLLPFDLEHRIVSSLKKTNKVIFFDEDVPGGASAYMMQEVLEKQNAYRYLDAAPSTLTAKACRPPYGSNGDYIVKPNADDLIEKVLEMLEEVEPERFS